MKRLRKKAMDEETFKSSLNQVSQKGRNILKSLEDFKFTLEQSAKLLTNDQNIAQGMIQKRKSVDEISSKLYQIVFDIENIDISEAFMQQDQQVMQSAPNKEINKPTNNIPGQPSIPGQPQPNIPGKPQSGIPGQPQPNMPNSTPGQPADNKKENDEEESEKETDKENDEGDNEEI